MPVLAAILVASIGALPLSAQQAGMQEKLAQIRASIAKNNAQLAQYTWQMQQSIAVNGDVKDTSVYQVQIVNGQQQKTMLSAPPTPSGREHGIKHRMEDRFKDYAQSVGALAQSYAQIDPAKLKQLYASGNVALKSGGAPGYSSIVISNYNKQGDSITLLLADATKALVRVNVASYLNDPSDVVTMQVTYAQLPDGTRYAQTTTVNGQSKGLVITQQNVDYQKVMH
jgi:hypothetical protein